MKEITGVMLLVSVVKWFGYMEIMEYDQFVKIIMELKMRGVRLKGRPRMEWMDGMKRALK